MIHEKKGHKIRHKQLIILGCFENNTIEQILQECIFDLGYEPQLWSLHNFTEIKAPLD